jgi:hypothetical protein
MLLIFCHVRKRGWEFHHLMAMRLGIRTLQLSSAASTVRRPTDNHFSHVLYGH